MDGATIIAVAGIFGTLAAPLLTERMRRRSLRDEQLIAQRLEVYADVLRLATRFVDNASFWSSVPLADLPEYEDEELNRIVARTRVVASNEVRACLQELMTCANQFNRMLVMEVRPHHEMVRREGKVDDVTGIAQRVEIGKLADRARDICDKLEKAIRKEWE